MEDHFIRDDIFTLHRADGDLRAAFPEAGGIWLRFGRGGVLPEEPLILDGMPRLLPCGAEQTGDSVTVSSGDLRLSIGPDGTLEARVRDRVWWTSAGVGLEALEDRTRLFFRSPGQDRIYGLGQDPMAALDHNHAERRMWNQWGGHRRSGNGGIGFFISTGGYGMLLNSTAAARVCFNESREPILDPLGEAMVPSPWDTPLKPGPDGGCVEVLGPMDVFLLPGDPAQILEQYHELTGLPGLMPKWAYGFLQCKNRYMDQDDLLETAARLRREDIPCDGLVIDWLWFREMGDMDWDRRDWPQPERMFAQLRDMGFRVSSAQHPFIWEQSKNYPLLLEMGFLNKTPPGKRFTYDHTDPEAREYWWKMTDALYRQGLRGYWTDMGELEEHFEGTVSHAGGRTQTHNAYCLYWTKGLYEGQRRDHGTRPFILSRACCAGLQRYGTAMWSGDIDASFQVLSDQIRIGQGMAMSGFPWWGTDIGGFYSDRECTPELYVRWMEWGVFCGLFRTHGTRPGNEPWSFGPEAQGHIRSLIRLRYRLMPYIYSLAMDCALRGTPLVRPLGFQFPEDPQAARYTGEYLFGPSLLVAPVTQAGARSVQVYLPEGTWQCWWTGKQYPQGLHTVAAPLGQPPLFVRAGAVIPTYGSVGRNVEEHGALEVLYVPAEHGAFDYYDDDGLSFGYVQGEYTHVRFRLKGSALEAEPLRGTVPPFTAKPLTAQGSGDTLFLDASWEADQAQITLCVREPLSAVVRLEPMEGWDITHCTEGGCYGEMYDPVYQHGWEQPVELLPGQVLRWTLRHTGSLRAVAVQWARVTLTGPDGLSQSRKVCWDGPFLSDPQILGCLEPDAQCAGPLPWEAPMEPFYTFGGRTQAWRRDLLYRNNCFGYVDLRRFDPHREGEAMLGQAWARELLWVPEDTDARFLLRHDGPITLWLNGQQLPAVEARSGQILLSLKEGRNILIARQSVDVARPYSGGEFGYSLCLQDDVPLFTLRD